jgi:hypothetical protein
MDGAKGDGKTYHRMKRLHLVKEAWAKKRAGEGDRSEGKVPERRGGWHVSLRSLSVVILSSAD